MKALLTTLLLTLGLTVNSLSQRPWEQLLAEALTAEDMESGAWEDTYAGHGRFVVSVQGSAGLAEPFLLVGVEVRREAVEDCLVVLVQPVDFLLQHHLANDGALVDGTECE